MTNSGLLLPNDLLRAMPFSETVETWPLNDTYLNIIQHLEALWRSHGYTWAFGTEINFRIAEAGEAEKVIRKQASLYGKKSRATHERLNQRIRGDMSPYFAAHAALPDSDAPFLKAIAEVEEMLEIQRRRIGYQSPQFRAVFEANERESQRIFKSYLHSDRTRRDHYKRANVFLAWLHIMPSAFGGVADMVDMRFGNERHGRGWWDCGDDIELRFFNRGAMDIIQTYNRANFLFFEACKRFGFIPRIKQNLSQLHFSVWQGENRNLMKEEDDEAIEMRRKMTDGLMTASTFLPFMYIGCARDSGGMVHDLSAGPTRLDGIRFCEESWELRRFYPDTLVHIAQDVAYTLIGASNIVFTDLAPATPSGGFIIKEASILELEYQDVSPFRHLRIRDHSDRKCAAIKSCLEAARVKDDGTLDVPMETIYMNHELLVEEIGLGAVDRYTVIEDGYVLNLGDIEYARVWQSLFSKIKYDKKRNMLDVSKLPKAVQEWFEPFEVSCVQTNFTQETRIVTAPEFINRMASDFESGVCRINHVPAHDTVRLGNFFKTFVARSRVKHQISGCVNSALLEKGIVFTKAESDGWHTDILANAIMPHAALAGRMKSSGIKGLGLAENLRTANDFYLSEALAYQEADAFPETKRSRIFAFERDLYADRARFFDVQKTIGALTKMTASHQRISDITIDASDDAHAVEYIIHFCAFLKKDHAAACREAEWLRDNWMDYVKSEIQKNRAFEAKQKEKLSKAPFGRDLQTPEISDATYMFIDAAVRRACDALPAMREECEAWAKKLPDALEVPLVMQEQQAASQAAQVLSAVLRP